MYKLEIVFEEEVLRDENRETIREFIEDTFGVAIVEINEVFS